MNDLTSVWNPLAWLGALLSGFAIGYVGLAVVRDRGLLMGAVQPKAETAAVVLFVLSLWSAALFWGTQVVAVILAGDPLWPRTLSRGLIEIVGHSAGVAVGVWLNLRRSR